ncbi:uncharacterized protein LOC108742151 [Agrilus planipennis]|uniref:Uncharacterized protein LOC108742151 n=1 Tax=Agrilus planipennis TaxID=224129 RepID=A0A1W4XIU2_AGRPL|nr:uncharacterized protein LOC108742151 [Agrilus planipennis]
MRPPVRKSTIYIKNFADVERKIPEINIKPGDILTSFDAISLFTKILLTGYLNLESRIFPVDMCKIFEVSLVWKVDYYEQVDGVTMESSLRPVIAKLFMEHFDKNAIGISWYKQTAWLLYVNDTFANWGHGMENLNYFLQHLNRHHPSIQLTMETENG